MVFFEGHCGCGTTDGESTEEHSGCSRPAQYLPVFGRLLFQIYVFLYAVIFYCGFLWWQIITVQGTRGIHCCRSFGHFLLVSHLVFSRSYIIISPPSPGTHTATHVTAHQAENGLCGSKSNNKGYDRVRRRSIEHFFLIPS